MGFVHTMLDDDAARHKVTWRENASLPGHPIGGLYVQRAKLYSFTIA